MIASILNEISVRMADQINWVDHNHGLAFSAPVTIPNSQVKVNLPFEWGILDCTQNSAILPDERYRSLSFFESSSVVNKQRMEGGNYLYNASARCIVWLNLNKINIDDAYIGDRCINNLEKYLSGLKFSNATHKLLNTDVKQVILDPKILLGKYTFDDKAKLSLYPHMWFGIDFNLSFVITDCEPITISPKC